MKYKNAYQTCAWITWYMFPVQCEEVRTNHLTPLLAVTMPYDCCWFFVWQANCIEDFKWRLHFQDGVAFWRGCFEGRYIFEGPNRVWRASKTSTLNTSSEQPTSWLQITTRGEPAVSSTGWVWEDTTTGLMKVETSGESPAMLGESMEEYTSSNEWMNGRATPENDVNM